MTGFKLSGLRRANETEEVRAALERVGLELSKVWAQRNNAMKETEMLEKTVRRLDQELDDANKGKIVAESRWHMAEKQNLVYKLPRCSSRRALVD